MDLLAALEIYLIWSFMSFISEYCSVLCLDLDGANVMSYIVFKDWLIESQHRFCNLH